MQLIMNVDIQYYPTMFTATGQWACMQYCDDCMQNTDYEIDEDVIYKED